MTPADRDVTPGTATAREAAPALPLVQVPIRLEVVWGRIGDATADVVVAGHYQDVYPAAAELALDEALCDGDDQRRRILHAATARGILKGTFGEVFLVPWPQTGREPRPRTAAVLGLGRPGSFKLPQHQVLMRNLVWTAERVVGATSVETVLIGSGAGNLPVADVVASLVRALDVAVKESELVGQLQVIRVVEIELGRARSIHQTLRQVVAERDPAAHPAVIDVAADIIERGGVAALATVLAELLHDVRNDTPDELARRIERLEASEPVREAMLAALAAAGTYGDLTLGPEERADEASVPTRLSVLVSDGQIVGSAVSDSATVPERPFGIDVALFTQLVELANSSSHDPADAGRMLRRLAVRPEFRPLLDQEREVVVEVDETTAGLPWEILGADTAGSSRLPPLGLRTPVARQLRTRRSAPPTVSGRVVLTRALVIGDPGGEAGRLPGAAREAEQVAALLRARGVTVDLLLAADTDSGLTEHPHRTGPATLANVLHHLLHAEYELVHYAGHGTFQPGAVSGWSLADGVLTGTHLGIIERMPPLLVANACHSARLSTGLPGLADEFISAGVRNLVGTARTVGDERAAAFSDHFYRRLLAGTTTATGKGEPTLGRAVLAGRLHLADAGGSDWEVYHLYGDPSFRYWADVLDRRANVPR